MEIMQLFIEQYTEEIFLQEMFRDTHLKKPWELMKIRTNQTGKVERNNETNLIT